MKRLLLDTNIYGLMVADPEAEMLKTAYEQQKSFLIYGFTVVRKELRETPKASHLLGKNLRVAMLSLYDAFVKEHTLEVEENILLDVAKKYYLLYQEHGGGKSEKELHKDFLIVACASLKEMDIVVSCDDASMLSEISLQAYKEINAILKLKTPSFLDYNYLKELLVPGMHPNKLVRRTDKFGIFLPLLNLFPNIFLFLFFHLLIKENLIYKDFVPDYDV